MELDWIDQKIGMNYYEILSNSSMLMLMLICKPKKFTIGLCTM